MTQVIHVIFAFEFLGSFLLTNGLAKMRLPPSAVSLPIFLYMDQEINQSTQKKMNQLEPNRKYIVKPQTQMPAANQDHTIYTSFEIWKNKFYIYARWNPILTHLFNLESVQPTKRLVHPCVYLVHSSANVTMTEITQKNSYQPSNNKTTFRHISINKHVYNTQYNNSNQWKKNYFSYLIEN